MTADTDLSLEHLQDLIATMRDWSMKQPWTEAQMAAWRLRWFGRTPERDRAAREAALVARFDREYERPTEREPFNDWPNGQGTYD